MCDYMRWYDWATRRTTQLHSPLLINKRKFNYQPRWKIFSFLISPNLETTFSVANISVLWQKGIRTKRKVMPYLHFLYAFSKIPLHFLYGVPIFSLHTFTLFPNHFVNFATAATKIFKTCYWTPAVKLQWLFSKFPIE